jgi:hypothetical protein
MNGASRKGTALVDMSWSDLELLVHREDSLEVASHGTRVKLAFANIMTLHT